MRDVKGFSFQTAAYGKTRASAEILGGPETRSPLLHFMKLKTVKVLPLTVSYIIQIWLVCYLYDVCTRLVSTSH